jgi:DNA-directed RNA polymerase specialized sigma24 family protein
LTTDYTAGSRQLLRIFSRRGCNTALAQDLMQDTWVSYLEARQRGSLKRDGLEPLGKMARWALSHHYNRRSACEEVTALGEFHDDAGVIQLYPEGGWKGDQLAAEKETRDVARVAGKCIRHPSRDAALGKTRCQECLDYARAKQKAYRAAKLGVTA